MALKSNKNQILFNEMTKIHHQNNPAGYCNQKMDLSSVVEKFIWVGMSEQQAKLILMKNKFMPYAIQNGISASRPGNELIERREYYIEIYLNHNKVEKIKAFGSCEYF